MAIPNTAITRNEQYLAAMAGQSGTLPDEPITRKEFYLAKAAGQAVETPEPITREEMYLDAIAEGGGGGGGGGSVNVDDELSSTSENPVQNKVVKVALDEKQNKVTEVTVATGGAVTQALEAGKWYHFTGALTSLTVTLTTTASGELAQYHFDFTSGATAPTVTIPNTVTMPDSFTVEANKRYEIDILNNYGAVMTWAIS